MNDNRLIAASLNHIILNGGGNRHNIQELRRKGKFRITPGIDPDSFSIYHCNHSKLSEISSLISAVRLKFNASGLIVHQFSFPHHQFLILFRLLQKHRLDSCMFLNPF